VIAAAMRIAASRGVRRGTLALGAAATALVALSPGDLAPAAARAALAAGGFFVAAALVRRRRAGEACRAAPLSVEARATLAQGAGVAVVEADGRRLLLSFGKDGARLILELTRPARAGEPS
jgi:hypothetical protein